MNCAKIRIHNLFSSTIHLINSNFENSIKNKNNWTQNINDYSESFMFKIRGQTRSDESNITFVITEGIKKNTFHTTYFFFL